MNETRLHHPASGRWNVPPEDIANFPLPAAGGMPNADAANIRNADRGIDGQNFSPADAANIHSVTGSVLGGDGSMSSEKVAYILAEIMKKLNKEFDKLLQDANNSPTKDNQGNTKMVMVQQKAGEINALQSLVTAIVQGLTDAQKETARNSH